MVYNKFLWGFLLVILWGCVKTVEQKICLKVEMTNSATESLYLQRLDSVFITVDTLRMDENGLYISDYVVPDINFYRLNNGNKSINLILGKDSLTEITIQSKEDSFSLSAIKNNNLTQELWKLEELSVNYSAQYNIIKKELYHQIGEDKNDTIQSQLSSELKILQKKYRKSIDQILENNRYNLVALPCVLQTLGNINLYSVEKELPFLQDLSRDLSAKYKNCKAVSLFSTRIDKAETLFNFSHKADIGNMMPEPEVPNAWGDLLPISGFRNKPVLVVVWSSNSIPSRQRNLEIRKMAWRYKSKGLEVYMVSLDNDELKWKSAIKEDRLAFWHVSDLLGNKSKAVGNLGITFVPSNFLLDDEGIIRYKNIWGKELEDALQAIFKN